MALHRGRLAIFYSGLALSLEWLQGLLSLANRALADLLGEAQRLLSLRLHGLVVVATLLHDLEEAGPRPFKFVILSGELGLLESELGL